MLKWILRFWKREYSFERDLGKRGFDLEVMKETKF